MTDTPKPQGSWREIWEQKDATGSLVQLQVNDTQPGIFRVKVDRPGESAQGAKVTLDELRAMVVAAAGHSDVPLPGV